MEKVFETLLAEVEVKDPVSVHGLQIFGLRSAQESRLDYVTLDEALNAGLVEITELTGEGSVPTLTVSNKSNRLLFLMAGEQLQGAKQNRVLNVSIIVPAASEVPIPVSCVEAGRWAYTSRKFSSPGTSSHSQLRASMTRDVADAYRRTGVPSSQQTKVWAEISRKLGKMGSRSPSSALNQVYQDYSATLDKIIDGLKCPEECAGAVFAFGGRIAGMDLFDQRETFVKLWPKLVRSYAIDAMESSEESPHVTAQAVGAWLKNAFSAKSEKFRSPGLGDDIRLRSDDHVGSSLVLENQPVHTEFFPAA